MAGSIALTMNNSTLVPTGSSAITFGESIIIVLTLIGLAIMVWPLFWAYINRPKLVITPHLEIRQVGVGENVEDIGWKTWFVVKNEGKNSAKLITFEVSAEREPRQRWQAPHKIESHAHPLFPPITYRNSTTFDWFSEGLQIRYSGDDYEYFVRGEKTSMWMFKKGDVGVVIPLNSIRGAVYGEGPLRKEFSAMLYVTGNPKVPFRLGLLHGLTEPQ